MLTLKALIGRAGLQGREGSRIKGYKASKQRWALNTTNEKEDTACALAASTRDHWSVSIMH